MTFGFLHLGPLLPQFLTAYPAIQVELSLNDRIVDLLEEGFDLAVRIGRLADSSLVARRLATTGFICAAAPAYLARAGAPAQPADLAQHNCLRYSYRRAAGGLELQPRQRRDHRPGRGQPQANNGDALRAAARAGLGIVYLPDFIAAADIATGELVRLLADWDTPQAPIHAVFPSQRHPPPSCARSSISWRRISPTGSTGRRAARARWGGADVQG